MSLPERVIQELENYTIVGECWEHNSAKSHGYPCIMVDGKVYALHRVACERKHGPTGLKLACHSCDNHRCINPDHLNPGSYSFNMLDRAAKKRDNVKKGEAHSKTYFTEQDIRDIRAIKNMTQVEIAKK